MGTDWKLGYRDGLYMKRGVVTEKTAEEMLDSYANARDDEEAYKRGLCEGACENPDVGCDLHSRKRRQK